MILFGFLLIFSGFLLLVLAMSRHQKQVFPSVQVKVAIALWRVSAAVLLCASLIPVVLNYGLSVGVATWFGMAMVAVLMIGLLLSYRPSVLYILLIKLVRTE